MGRLVRQTLRPAFEDALQARGHVAVAFPEQEEEFVQLPYQEPRGLEVRDGDLQPLDRHG